MKVIEFVGRKKEDLLKMSFTALYAEKKLANLTLKKSKEFADFKKAKEKFENSAVFTYSKLVDESWSDRVDAPNSLKDRVKKRFSVKRDSIDQIKFNNERFIYSATVVSEHDRINTIEPYTKEVYLKKRHSDSFKTFGSV
mgnify:CR=1 FL=1|tara:strand:+ start:69 stop:488 length:420 start_codon:yes stop_codon:yes gene_type:complete